MSATLPAAEHIDRQHVNALMERFKPETEPGKQTKVCPECKSKIPWDATRCAFCTVEQPPLAEATLKT